MRRVTSIIPIEHNISQENWTYCLDLNPLSPVFSVCLHLCHTKIILALLYLKFFLSLTAMIMGSYFPGVPIPIRNNYGVHEYIQLTDLSPYHLHLQYLIILLFCQIWQVHPSIHKFLQIILICSRHLLHLSLMILY